VTSLPTSGTTSTGALRAAPGSLVGGRYSLRAAVGHGGMGTVWRASDTLLRRDVAVKEVVLPPGLAPSDRDAMYERTLREARAAAALQHPAVVQVYDVVTEAGRPWIVMELLDARSLADIVIDDGPMAPRPVAKIGIALLGALEVAHANGVLHRDVKPANVLICADGRCVLTDFGVARMPTDVQLTTPGMVLGSPHFISPERAMGSEFGPPSDLFSLGVTLYTAVEGRPPFDKGDAIETMHAVVEDPPAPTQRAGVLTDVLFGLLEKDPAKRYDVVTARGMLRELMAGPLASKAPAHLMTDPYAIVPAQRNAYQPAPAPPKPTGQIGGRAMIGPGESLTDRLAALRGGGASDATAVQPTSPSASGVPTPEAVSALPAGPPLLGLPPGSTGEMPAAPWDAPTGVGAPGPAGSARKLGPGRLDGGLRRGGASLLARVRTWPLAARFGVAGGLAVVLILGTVAIFTAGGDGAGPTPQAARAPSPSAAAATFPTQTEAARGLSVNVPDGWVRKASSGVWVDFIDPDDSNRKVRILVEKSSAGAGKFLAAAANRLDQNTSGTCARPYRQVSLQDVTVDGEPGSQLEYTCGSGSTMRHGLWQAVIRGGKAYSFFLTTPDERFAESKPIFDEMARTFAVTAA
jgi:eukaryotic-like serine/threonine-protein kinase